MLPVLSVWREAPADSITPLVTKQVKELMDVSSHLVGPLQN